MKIEFLDKAARYVSSFDEKKLKKYMHAAFVVSLLAVVSWFYYVDTMSESYIEEYKKLEKFINSANDLIARNQIIEKEKEKILALLDSNKSFNIKTAFEQFCTQNGLPVQPGWPTATIPLPGEEFEEVILTASFGGQNISNLVKVLNSLNNNPTMYLKSISVRKEEGKNTINFTLTIATNRRKKS